MAVRMNEFWTAVSSVFCFLLIHSCVCQDGTTIVPFTQTTADNTTTEAPQTANTQPDTNNITVNTVVGKLDVQPGSTLRPSDISAEATQNSPTASQTPLPNIPEVPQFPDSKKQENIESPEEHKERNIKNESTPLNLNEDKKEENVSGSPAVFVSVLVTGLLLAALIIGLYYFRCHRRPSAKGIKLAEETFVADEENQGNTLVSVAPLNQPESEEKPSLNGEPPEDVKNQTTPAATNGHSATKTADTEM